MNGKKIIMIVAAVTLSASMLTGCGKLDGTEIVATLNGKDIEVGLVNLKAQITAASYDTYLVSYYGADMWEGEGSTEGETMADEVRRETLEEVELQYLLEEHMGDYDVTLSDSDLANIETYTAQFLSDNDDKALEAMGATEEYVREMFRLTAIEKRMQDAIEATADTEVTEEELAEAGEDATEDTVISQRKSDLYNEVTEGYKDSADWTVNESVLKKISFKNFLSIVQEESTEEVSAETEEIAETEEAVEIEETEEETVEATEALSVTEE